MNSGWRFLGPRALGDPTGSAGKSSIGKGVFISSPTGPFGEGFPTLSLSTATRAISAPWFLALARVLDAVWSFFDSSSSGSDLLLLSIISAESPCVGLITCSRQVHPGNIIGGTSTDSPDTSAARKARY